MESESERESTAGQHEFCVISAKPMHPPGPNWTLRRGLPTLYHGVTLNHSSRGKFCTSAHCKRVFHGQRTMLCTREDRAEPAREDTSAYMAHGAVRCQSNTLFQKDRREDLQIASLAYASSGGILLRETRMVPQHKRPLSGGR